MEGRQFMERKRIALAERKGVLTKLFFSTLYLSAFTFGGGYVIVTLLKRKFVDEYHWIEEDEMLDLVAIAQSAPGPIAVNGAIITGYKVAGVPGLFVAVLGTVLPPFVILSVISFFYDAFRSNEIVSMALAGMQAGVGAVIASVVWDMAGGVIKEKDRISDLVMAAAFFLSVFLNVNAVFIILGCGLLGVVRTLAHRKGEKR